MKKIFIFPILVGAFLLALQAGAQTEKGRLMFNLQNFNTLGGGDALDLNLAPTTVFGVGFGTNKVTIEEPGVEEEELKFQYANLGLSAAAHYFVANHFSVGVNLNFANQRYTLKEVNGEEVEEEEGVTENQFLLGPEVRYYYPINDAFQVFLRASAAFGSINISSGKDPVLTQYNGGAGLAYFPFRNAAINLGLNYGIANQDNNDDIKTENKGFGVDVGFSIFFGGNNAE